MFKTTGNDRKQTEEINKRPVGTLSFACPPLPANCGWSVPGIFHYSAEVEIVPKKGDCKNVPQCDIPILTPLVELNIVPSGIAYGNPNPCIPNAVDNAGITKKIQTGGFLPLHWRNSQTIHVEPCLNVDEYIQFNMIVNELGTKLKPEAVLSICEGNIRASGLVLINDVNQMLDTLKKFPNELNIFENDLENERKYNSVAKKYLFKPVILAHETQHKSDYQEALQKNKSSLLISKIKEYKITCTDFKKPYDEAMVKAKYYFENLVKEYIKETIDKDYGKNYGFVTEAAYENDVQARTSVQEKIEDFLSALDAFKINNIRSLLSGYKLNKHNWLSEQSVKFV